MFQAVNKLAEIMNRKDFSKTTKKVAASLLTKKDKECRKLQQDLTQERDKYNKMVDKFHRDLSDAQANYYDEAQLRSKIQVNTMKTVKIFYENTENISSKH